MLRQSRAMMSAFLRGVLQRQAKSAAHNAVVLPFVAGKVAMDVAVAVPKVAAGFHGAAALQFCLRRAGVLQKNKFSEFGGMSSMAGRGWKAQKGIWKPLSSHANDAARNSAQHAVEGLNDILGALGIEVCIMHPSLPNARVAVAVDGPASAKEAAERRRAAALTPQQFVIFMREASGCLDGSGLQDYVDHITSRADLEWVPFLPHSFSRKLHLDIARLIVFTFQRGVLSLDKADVWGHELRVTMISPPTRFHSSRLRNRKSVVGGHQLEAIVDSMMKNTAMQMPLVPRMVQRRLYKNCMSVVFLLLEDLLTGQNEHVSFMGHKLRFHLRPKQVEEVRRMLERNPVAHCRINEAVLDELVSELLNDPETNIFWLPDVFERHLYLSSLRCVIRVVEQIVAGMQLSILGRDINMSILSNIEVSEAKAKRKAIEREFEALYGEENPVQSLSTTELEERLEDIYSQRKILEALQDLGDAEFDLTKETPMQSSDGKSVRPDLRAGKTPPIKSRKTPGKGRNVPGGQSPFPTPNFPNPLAAMGVEMPPPSPFGASPASSTGASTSAAFGNFSEGTAAKEGPAAAATATVHLSGSVGVQPSQAAAKANASGRPARPIPGEPHEFQRLAHTLKLARTLSQTFIVDADIEIPYSMIADLETYPEWMPWCTSGKFVNVNMPDTPEPRPGEAYSHGEVGFGFETKTFLGTLGDTVFYRVRTLPPSEGDAAGTDGPPYGSITADAVQGFTYGKRLIYDWRFTEIHPGRTKIDLDLLFQAHNVLYMPLWDSMQNMVVNNMLHAFEKRALMLQKTRPPSIKPKRSETSAQQTLSSSSPAPSSSSSASVAAPAAAAAMGPA